MGSIIIVTSKIFLFGVLCPDAAEQGNFSIDYIYYSFGNILFDCYVDEAEVRWYSFLGRGWLGGLRRGGNTAMVWD